MKQDRKKQETSEMNFCDYNCRYAQPERNIPLCMAHNPIYCKRKQTQVSKSQLCVDYEAREK